MFVIRNVGLVRDRQSLIVTRYDLSDQFFCIHARPLCEFQSDVSTKFNRIVADKSHCATLSLLIRYFFGTYLPNFTRSTEGLSSCFMLSQTGVLSLSYSQTMRFV